MYVELGKIVGVWGVRGWVKLHSYTRHREDISNYTTWWLQSKQSDKPVSYKILNCRQQGQGIVAQIEGLNDREQAQALNGQIILVDKKDLPRLPNGQFYWQQLIGLTAKNLEGEDMGQVESILETGANDVLVLERQLADAEQDTQEVLIPYVDEVVKNVDLENGTMTVDWDLSYLD